MTGDDAAPAPAPAPATSRPPAPAAGVSRTAAVPFHRIGDDAAPCLKVDVDPSLTHMFEPTPERGLCFVLSGDTYAPAAARGDVIMIDPTMRDLREGGVFALELDGDFVIRRVDRKMDRSLVLRSDNPLYEPCHIPAAEVAALTVLGRVRWALRAM